jgi:hypothetical protein
MELIATAVNITIIMKLFAHPDLFMNHHAIQINVRNIQTHHHQMRLIKIAALLLST